MRTLLLALAISLGASALAQQRTTVLELEEGDLIEGVAGRPDAEPVTAAPRGREHTSLIRVRQDFRAEAMESAGEL